jgi:oxygen-independent coproporphyrinogen III oxidase
MDEAALYIHIPFCVKKCMYCDFPSFCGKDSLMTDYARALASEIITNTNNKTIKTIFIGGGTPTYLSLEAWKIISESISKVNKKNDLEFTVECNPGTITEEKLLLFKNMGVNRLSIGLQAWQNSLLKKIGRVHTVEEFLWGYNMARSFGFNNINVDLMFGLPDQSLEQWIETLKRVIELAPEHISCYSLIIEEGTPFYNLYKNEKISLPNEEVERMMYEESLNILKNNRYIQYEISNFSLKGKECRHNIVYWRLEDYIGCGSASHSYIKGKRYRNEINIEKYIEKINSEGNAVVEIVNNSIEDEMEEFMFMGLRMISGVNLENFKKRFNKDLYIVYDDVIKKHTLNGLLEIGETSLFLTCRGIELSNIVMSDFIILKD